MTLTPLDLLLAWLLDAALGDPRWLPWSHPVVWIGRMIRTLEKHLFTSKTPPRHQLYRGTLLWVTVLAATLAAGGVALALAAAIHPWLGHAAAVYAAYACLATRDLSHEAGGIAGALRRRDLPAARRLLARVVGRDTARLSEPEVARAAVETVAENTSDGVVAPLFYLALGGALGLGPLLGLAYKAVNTMDSMLGYRTTRYEWFGKTAARLDDAANWLPARITAGLAILSAQMVWRSGGRAWRVARRDGRRHKSPNAGYPEAAFAGALGVQLGGDNLYDGVIRPSPRLGDPGAAPTAAHVGKAVTLLWSASAAALALGLALLAAGSV